jgi:hypothetical protein
MEMTPDCLEDFLTKITGPVIVPRSEKCFYGKVG